MRIALFGQPNQKLNQKLMAAALAKGHDCEFADLQQLSWKYESGHSTPHIMLGNRNLLEFNVGLVRGIPPGSLEQVVFRMDLLESIREAGLRLVNSPKAIECAIDKFLTVSRCQRAGLPVPKTSCCESAELALELFERLGRDVIVKPIFGAEGRGMVRVSDLETARRVFRAWEQIGAVILIQEVVKSNGSDLRLLVLGGQVLGAIRRSSADDFRTNCAQTGTACLHEWTDQEAELALAACRVTGVDFGGVDLIYDEKSEAKLLEVNASPGWLRFEEVTGVPVAERVIEWLEST